MDDSIREGKILRNNHTIGDYLKVFFGNDAYNLAKNKKNYQYNIYQNTLIEDMNFSSLGLLNVMIEKIMDKFRILFYQHRFLRHRRYFYSPIGSVFCYVETSGAHYGNSSVFLFFERSDLFQISKISVYNRFSSSNPNLRTMGRFRIHLLLEDNVRSTHCKKNLQMTDIANG